MPYIDIMRFLFAGGGNDLDLAMLAGEVERVFHIETRLSSLELELDFAYHPERTQYHSTALLAKLLQIRPRDAVRILGVTNVDLFIPILTYVFGEAQFDGPTAVVSAHRLHNAFYGLPEEERLLAERLGKEAVHELGHTFGLVHCANQVCAMNASVYVENIDLKGRELCLACSEILNERLPSAAGGKPLE